MPEARQWAEGADAVGLHLAQDLTEVHRGRGRHSISDFIRPAEAFLLSFAQCTADHVHANAWRLGEIALHRVQVRHDGDDKVPDA